MISLTKGTVLRIVNKYTNEYGIVTTLPEDIEISGNEYDPETKTLYSDIMLEFEPAVYTLHEYRGETDDIIYVPSDLPHQSWSLPISAETWDVGTISITSTIVPVVSPWVFNNDARYDGTILIGTMLYHAPLRQGETNTLPLQVPEYMLDLIEKEIDDRGYTIHLNVSNYMDVAKHMIQMYSYGYKIDTINPFYAFNSRRYELANIHEFALAFPLPLCYLKIFMNMVWDYKQISNSLLRENNAKILAHTLEKHNHLFHTVSRVMGWFLIPDGYHGYRKKLGYIWMHTIPGESITIPILPEYTTLITSHLSVVPRVNDSITDNKMFSLYFFGNDKYGINEPEIKYTLISPIVTALRTINSLHTKVVLAGGFVVTKGDYDFFILDGDVNTAYQLMKLLNVTKVTVSNSVISTEYPYKMQFILTTDMHDIFDVLYSFDFSHAMIAHDGYRYHISPEFYTFTSAGCSLMVLPVIKTQRLRKITNLGYIVVYPHTKYMVVDIESPVENSQWVDPNTAISLVQPNNMGYINFIYMSTNNTRSMILQGKDITDDSSSIYMDENGTNVGYYPLMPEQYYYVEMIGNARVILIRKIYGM